jgi:hypothetical protein
MNGFVPNEPIATMIAPLPVSWPLKVALRAAF